MQDIWEITKAVSVCLTDVYMSRYKTQQGTDKLITNNWKSTPRVDIHLVVYYVVDQIN